MAARASGASAAPVVFGVSTERGAVHAVALGGAGERLADRVLAQCTVACADDRRAAPAAVIAALDRLAAELRREPAGVAVAYHDPAERRALVTGLAAGRWHAASLVSTRAAHLNVAGAMTWLAEFDDLLLCDVVPGHLTLTLVDRDRGRVLAGVARTGGVTSDALGAAVTAARDQLDAAETRPDAVVLIGSAAAEPAVADAVRALGAPVLPCTVAVLAPALGAALAIAAEPGGVAEAPVPPSRSARTAALLGAAALAAGFTVAGGAYLVSGERPVPAPLAAGIAAPTLPVPAPMLPQHISAAAQLEQAAGAPQRLWLPVAAQVRASEPLPLVAAESAAEPARAPADACAALPAGAATAAPSTGSAATPGAPAADPALSTACSPDPAAPGTGVPARDEGIGAPDAALLFPGEPPAPAPFTPDAAAWWQNHVRLAVAWAIQQVLPG
ncbi:hypothetical protein AB0H71_16165 [Nocardia sp. NPDC050697]|uniref:hypothetical protein n=1 Tax=Nocardia sp. NPDC050697 TaxID=3155158 RepID=UPI0033CA2A0E